MHPDPNVEELMAAAEAVLHSIRNAGDGESATVSERALDRLSEALIPLGR